MTEYYGRIRYDDPDYNASLLNMTPQQTKQFIKDLDKNKQPRYKKNIEEQIITLKQEKFRKPLIERMSRREELIEHSQKAHNARTNRKSSGGRKYNKIRKTIKKRKNVTRNKKYIRNKR